MSTRRSVPPPAASHTSAATRGHTVQTTHVTASPFVTNDPRIAWEHFLPAAQQVPTADLPYLRSDPHLAMHNVRVGLASVEPQLDALAARNQDVKPAALRELPALALALEFASGRVSPVVVTRHEIAAKREAVTTQRRLTLDFLDMFSELEPELLAPGTVAKFRSGSGPLTMASQCVQIVDIFRTTTALHGRHPFTEKYIDRMAEDAAWLLRVLRPNRAKRMKAPRTPDAIVRDQFAALLAERHEDLRTAGVLLFGLRNVDEKVPPLYSGTREVAPEAETTDDTQDDDGNG